MRVLHKWLFLVLFGPRCISCAVQERSSANLPLPVLELLGVEQVNLRGKPRVESRGDVSVAHIWELMLFSPHAAHLSREFFRGRGVGRGAIWGWFSFIP